MSKGGNVLTVSALSGALLFGCASPTSTEQSPPAAQGQLENVHLNPIGADKPGSWNAVNFGESAVVYEDSTYHNLGRLAAHEGFQIICSEGPKPVSWYIGTRYEGHPLFGVVNLGGQAEQQVVEGQYDFVPPCEHSGK
jgi:hypothetical protein